MKKNKHYQAISEKLAEYPNSPLSHVSNTSSETYFSILTS